MSPGVFSKTSYFFHGKRDLCLIKDRTVKMLMVEWYAGHLIHKHRRVNVRNGFLHFVMATLGKLYTMGISVLVCGVKSN